MQSYKLEDDLPLPLAVPSKVLLAIVLPVCDLWAVVQKGKAALQTAASAWVRTCSAKNRRLHVFDELNASSY